MRIVIGIDFNEASLAAAQWVGRQLAPDAALTLVHVIADPLLPNVMRLQGRRHGTGQTPFSARVESLRGALYGVAKAIGRTNTTVDVRVGDPALQLAACADMADADLVVVGGPTRFHATPHSETATVDRLLRQLTQAVLVVRQAPAPPTTALAVLAADAPAPVLAYARRIAAPTEARVVALRLSNGRSNGGLGTVEDSTGEPGARRGPDAGARREQVRMIVNVAREQRAEVIVIGSPVTVAAGEDDIVSMLVRTAPCSVLVVPRHARPLLPWDAGRARRNVRSPADAMSAPPAA